MVTLAGASIPMYYVNCFGPTNNVCPNMTNQCQNGTNLFPIKGGFSDFLIRQPGVTGNLSQGRSAVCNLQEESNSAEVTPNGGEK